MVHIDTGSWESMWRSLGSKLWEPISWHTNPEVMEIRKHVLNEPYVGKEILRVWLYVGKVCITMDPKGSMKVHTFNDR